MAKILEREPRWEALPGRTPAGLLSLLKRCLRKDTRRRVHDIADVRIVLEETIEEPSSDVPTAPHRRSVVPVLISMIVTALIVFGLTRSETPVARTNKFVPLKKHRTEISGFTATLHIFFSNYWWTWKHTLQS